VQFGILHLVCDNLLSACGKCPTPSSRISLMALCSFLLLVVGVVGLKMCLHYLIFNWSFYLTNIIEKIFKKSRMHSIFIFRLSDLICEFSFELMSFAVIIIIKFFLNSSFFYYCF
jgi:hypothetical protein